MTDSLDRKQKWMDWFKLCAYRALLNYFLPMDNEVWLMFYVAFPGHLHLCQDIISVTDF